MDLSNSKNMYLQGAAAHRKRLEAEAQKKRLEDKELDNALAELEHRSYMVSFPDYQGPDSAEKIRQDKIALEEYLDTLPKSDQAMAELRRNDPELSDSEQLAAIRKSLEGGDGATSAAASSATRDFATTWTTGGKRVGKVIDGPTV